MLVDQVLQTLRSILLEDPTLQALATSVVTHQDIRTPCPYIMMRVDQVVSNHTQFDHPHADQMHRKTQMHVLFDITSHHQGVRELHAIAERLRGLLEGELIPIVGAQAKAMLKCVQTQSLPPSDLGHHKMRLYTRIFVRG